MSCDSLSDNKAFKDKFSFPYDLLCDTDRAMSIAYGAVESVDAPYPKRISYLIKPDGKIAKVYTQVTPAEHPDEVLAAIG